MALKRVCPICKGAATDQYCEQTGWQYYGRFEDMLGVFLSFEILDATDPLEYSALSVANKEIYGLIISGGMVNLREGNSKDALFVIFPEGTTTRANLQALIDTIVEPENVPPIG